MRCPLLPQTTLFAAVMLLSAVGCGSEPRQATPRAAPPAQADPPPAVVPRGYPGALPPLPQVPFQPARPLDLGQAVYAFAARHPEILHHVPCFCGCERQGHRGNDDCFVASREADGRPQWEMHGYV